MHAFDILGDPVRRRICELLASAASDRGPAPTEGELTSGEIVRVIHSEFGISQSAVSQHLRILRDHGFASVRPEGARRLYRVQGERFREIDEWLSHFRVFWAHRLEALATEVARGKARARKTRTRKPKNASGAKKDSAEAHAKNG